MLVMLVMRLSNVKYRGERGFKYQYAVFITNITNTLVFIYIKNNK